LVERLQLGHFRREGQWFLPQQVATLAQLGFDGLQLGAFLVPTR
jgi:hypothetical protein